MLRSPEGPKIKKIRDFDRDWKFRSRMKFSSEPPTVALFFVGKSRHRYQNFRARSKISIEIEHFDRDQIFLIVGPSGRGSLQVSQNSPEVPRTCPEVPQTSPDLSGGNLTPPLWLSKIGGGQTCNNERATSICPVLFIIFSSLLFSLS